MEEISKAVPLSGWDVAYALRFGEVNHAIRATATLPPPLRLERIMVAEDDDFGMATPPYRLVVTAEYSGWSLIGSESGSRVGALVKLQALAFEVQPLREDPAGPYSWQHPQTKVTTTYSALRSTQRLLANEVGIRLSMNLRWYQSTDGQRYELKRDDKASKVNVNPAFLLHPDDEAVLNGSKTYSPVIRQEIADRLAQDVVTEFDHIFATVDYTHLAENVAAWLKPVTHSYSVSTTGLVPDYPDDPVAAYRLAMQPEAGYPAGTLIIVGMTARTDAQGRSVVPNSPASIPSDLTNLIPAGCQAGYAYNDNLVIKQLLAGHLPELFDCDVARDFAFDNTGQRTLRNVQRLRLKNKVRLDYGAYALTPEVDGFVEKGGLVISLQSGRITYQVNTVYSVPKGVLGFGLPYEVDIAQSLRLVFAYTINTQQYAELTLAEEPTLTAVASPHYEEHEHAGFWQTMKAFGLSLGENLAIMALTMGAMKVSSLLYRGGKALGTVKWSKAKVTSPVGEVAEIALTEGELATLAERQSAEIRVLEETQASITAESETALQAAKQEGRIAASESGKSFLWEIVKFTFWQTAVTHAQQGYQNYSLNSLTELAKRESFARLVHGGIGHIRWSNQGEQVRFEVQQGGLCDGAFVVGLNLSFAR